MGGIDESQASSENGEVGCSPHRSNSIPVPSILTTPMVLLVVSGGLATLRSVLSTLERVRATNQHLNLHFCPHCQHHFRQSCLLHTITLPLLTTTVTISPCHSFYYFTTKTLALSSSANQLSSLTTASLTGHRLRTFLPCSIPF